jgi:hypothetical protein
VVAVGVTVTAVAVVAARLPGVMTPVPFANTPVRVAFCPAVIVAGFAVKLEMDAAGGGGGGLEEPPQPVKFVRPRPRVATHVARTKSRFMIFPVAKKVLALLAANDTALLAGLGRLNSETCRYVCRGRRRAAGATVPIAVFVFKVQVSGLPNAVTEDR